MVQFPSIGDEYAGYRIEGLLGRGGMSVVYQARHLGLERSVALKLISPELAEDEEIRKRFIRECQLAASLDHPNIVPIFEAGESDGVLYIAMRYVRGSDLKDVLRTKGQLDPDETLSVIGQVAKALDAAHEQGLVHRDVKPGNILVTSGGRAGEQDHVYLSDFGLTKRIDSGSALTKIGQFVGTVDYVAPEQIRGEPVDSRADIYSLGCVLYQCLTGAVPYARDDDLAVLWAHVHDRPPSVSKAVPTLAPAVDDVIARAMATSPDDRFQTCRELVASLRPTTESREMSDGGVPPFPPAPTLRVEPRPAPAIEAMPTSTGMPVTQEPDGAGADERRRRALLVSAIGVVVLAAGVAIAVMTLTDEDPAEPGADPVEPAVVGLAAQCDLLASSAGTADGDGSAGAPFDTVQRLIEALAPDEVGCVRGSFTGDVRIDHQVALRADPGETAAVNGRLVVTPDAEGTVIQGLTLNGARVRGVPTVEVEADNVQLLQNDITNEHGPDTVACLFVSGEPYGTFVDGVVVAGNVIHECGDTTNQGTSIGISVGFATNTQIVNNVVFGNGYSGIQIYPAGSHTTLSYNTIDGNGDGIEISFDPDQSEVSDTYSPSADNEVSSNVISNPVRRTVYTRTAGTGNTVEDNCLWDDGGSGLGNTGLSVGTNVTEEPVFVDPPRDYLVAEGACAPFGISYGPVEVDGVEYPGVLASSPA